MKLKGVKSKYKLIAIAIAGIASYFLFGSDRAIDIIETLMKLLGT